MHHSKLVLPYDFPQATIANGPETEMEYPTTIFSGPAFGMITHELGHEWFPMLAGSNETWDGSQEEGFNEFTDAAAAVDFEKKPTDWSREGGSYRRIAGSELEAAMMWPTDFAGPYYSIQSNVKQVNGTLTLTVADRGEMPMPVIARGDFTDSSSQTIKRPASFWFPGARSTTLTLPLRGKSVAHVTLDPENRFQDLDRSDNRWNPKR